jgi:uncharacterized protein (DUF885 family)
MGHSAGLHAFAELLMPSAWSRWLVLPVALAFATHAAPADAATRKKATERAQATAATPAPARAPATRAPSQSKAQRLQKIYQDYWNASLKLNPLQATFQGDSRWNDQLPNYLAPAFRSQTHEFNAEWLSRVEAIGQDGLSGQDLLSYRIFVSNARMAQQGERFPTWMLPVNQYNNPAVVIALLGSGSSAQAFASVADYDAWARRALGVPALFDQAIANMRQGVAAGVVQPRSLMEKVLPQLDAIIRPTAEETLFWAPVRNLPEDIPAEERARIAAEYKRLIELRLMPAYRRLRGYIATEYLPATRTGGGMAELPGGADWYAYNVRQSTTTDLTPEQLHQLGLEEVERIQADIEALMKQARVRGNQQKFLRTLQQDKRFRVASEKDLLAAYADMHARVAGRIPALFPVLPRAALEIAAVEPHRGPSAPAAAYQRPAGDGLPGVLQVNTHDLPSRRSWSVAHQFLHEGIPGHHLQLALQQELSDIPAFRRQAGETAYTEGWGLYAESLGRELGVYEDPYALAGYLQSELARAIRLVADTGLHAKGWSQQQAIDYMVGNSGFSQAEAVAEVERYLAMPGQALAYKAGELKIQQLRSQAKAALGERFDLGQFHARVLEDGAVPLEVLEAKIQAWIDELQAVNAVSG